MDIIENIAITLLALMALAGFIWLMLLVLQWGLKLKSGSREQDGLVDLWQEAMTGQVSKDKNIKPDQPNQ